MGGKAKGRHQTIDAYNQAQSPSDQRICNSLRKIIDQVLTNAESKMWHAHPVWFLDGNPIVGYSKLKDSIRLMFWSGQSFSQKGLVHTGSFKAADIRYEKIDDVDPKLLKGWLIESKSIQWDYKNIVKRKGRLERLPIVHP